jgi:hypothetical protein
LISGSCEWDQNPSCVGPGRKPHCGARRPLRPRWRTALAGIQHGTFDCSCSPIRGNLRTVQFECQCGTDCGMSLRSTAGSLEILLVPASSSTELPAAEARPAGTPGRGAQITAVVEFCAFQSRPSLPEVGTATTEPTAPGGCRNGRWLSGAVRAQAPRPDVLTTPEVQPMVVGAGKRNIGQMRFRADSSSFR